MKEGETFKTIIMNPKQVLFEGEAWSVFLPGTTGEFEILKLHKFLVSMLRKGDIIIDWKKRIPIRKGVVKMYKDELVALVE